MSESSPLTTEQCRICLDDDHADNMIYPCLCSGTSKYVHDTCLKQWIIMSDNPEFKKKCPSCHHAYTIQEHNINDNAIKCNTYYQYLQTNFWRTVFINQAVLIILTFFIAFIDVPSDAPTGSLYNATVPFIDNMTEFHASPFFVYYSLSSIFYISSWFFTIALNIILLKDATVLYLKKLPLHIYITAPAACFLSIYLNMISILLGTVLITKLVQYWVIYHLHVIRLIKTVKGFHIRNYTQQSEPPALAEP